MGSSSKESVIARLTTIDLGQDEVHTLYEIRETNENRVSVGVILTG